jgi:hypothetical protein
MELVFKMSITNQLIQKYNLNHIRGGWYKQTYKSNEEIAVKHYRKFNGEGLFQLLFIFIGERKFFCLSSYQKR